MSYIGRSAKLSRKSQDKVSFLATAGQTVRTGLSYVPAFVDITVNGITLTDTTDYTATNGSSVTFLVALSADDEVTIISLKTFALANHYNKTESDAAFQALDADTAKTDVAQTFTAAQTFGPNSAMTGTTLPDDASNYNISIEQSGANVTGDYDAGLAFVANQGGSVKAGVLSYDGGGSGKTGLAFVVNDGSLLEALNIDADGIVTKPKQPAFHAKSNADQALVNGTVVVLFQVENQDTNNDFASNVFTSPVSGTYQINFAASYEGGKESSDDTSYYGIYKNNSAYANHVYNPIRWSGVGVENVLSASAVIYLEEGDTCDIRTNGCSQTPSPVLRNGFCHFSGHLIG